MRGAMVSDFGRIQGGGRKRVISCTLKTGDCKKSPVIKILCSILNRQGLRIT